MSEHKLFLQFLVNGSNKKQNIKLLKFIGKDQISILQKISRDILEEKIPLTKKNFDQLYQHKNFIRKLGRKTVTKSILIKNYNIICTLVNIFLEYDAKNSSSTFGRVGKDKKFKDSSETSDSESTCSKNCSTETSENSEYSRYESEGEGTDNYFSFDDGEEEEEEKQINKIG